MTALPESSDPPPGRLLGGIDVGGTKIGVCLGDQGGAVLASERLANDASISPEKLLGRARSRLLELAEQLGRGPLAAVGAACPGPLDYRQGRLLEVPNMPLWHGFGVARWLGAEFDCPSRFMNDANASVLAEALWGAARGVDTAVFLTMSTGMGAGLWLGGRVFEGPLALAGEIGHIRLRDDGPVGFGKRGSVEGYTSGPGIAQVAAAELLARRQSGAPTRLGESGPVDAEQVCVLAAAGDPGALAVVDRCGGELGRLAALLVDLLNPDVIVLGTIGVAWPQLWLPRMRAVIDAEAIPAAAAHVRLEVSGLPKRGDQTALAIAASALAGTSGGAAGR